MTVLTNTTQKRNAWINWLDHCRSGVFVDQYFFGKTIGGVPEPWAEVIRALEQALKATGYTPKSSWAYNFRGISGVYCSCSNYGNCSLHGNGIAIDIDPKLNPYISTGTFRWSDTAFTPEQIAAVEGIKNTKGEQLIFWGGRWISIKDYMHFEANTDPASCKVNWDTVPSGTTPPKPKPEPPKPPSGDITLQITRKTIKKGSADTGYGQDVRQCQAMLVAWSYWASGDPTVRSMIDGKFGPTTDTLVRVFQRDKGLVVDGIVGAKTWAKLEA